MQESDCYVVLGLSRDANLSQIRRAYRELCRRFDPGRADVADAEVYDGVRRAYRTLSDPVARAEYERELMAQEQDLERMSGGPPPLSSPRHLLDDYEHHQPSRDELKRALMDDYTDHLPKAHPMREVNVEVVLDPEQAAAGGVVPFRVPAAQACHACAGTGRTGFFHCDACDGHGVTWSLASVDVVIPRNAPSGMTIPVSLKSAGLSTLYLNVTVRTAPPA
jgi:molecular chaperone DnaJ